MFNTLLRNLMDVDTPEDQNVMMCTVGHSRNNVKEMFALASDTYLGPLMR